MRTAALLLFTVATAALAQTPPPAPPAHADMANMPGMNHSDMTAPKTPMLLEGYGNGGFPITTRVPKAQAFFNNGMALAHAFAHEAFIARAVLNGRAAMIDHRYDEAAAAFRTAAELQENAEFSAISDPPAWYYPARRDLAAALLAKGDVAGARREAEATLAYRQKDAPTLKLLAGLPKGAAR